MAFAVVLVTLLTHASEAAAHGMLMNTIRERTEVTVTPENIDIHCALTFHEIRSLAERRRMDRNHDNTISNDELARYLEQLAEKLAGGMTLTVDDIELELTTLYEPRIDLLNTRQVALAHHELELFYFARSPASLHAGSQITVTSHHWPAEEKLSGFEAFGKNGVELVSIATMNSLQGKAAPSDDRLQSARFECTAVSMTGESEDTPSVPDEPEATVRAEDQANQVHELTESPTKAQMSFLTKRGIIAIIAVVLAVLAVWLLPRISRGDVT
jgi:hypothetical protein